MKMSKYVKKIVKQAVVGAKKLFPFVSQYGITAIYDAGMMGFENELFEVLSQMEKENKLDFLYFVKL